MKPPSRFTEERIIGILPGAQGGSEDRGRVSQVPNQQRGLLKMEGLVCGLEVLLAEFVAAATRTHFLCSHYTGCVPDTGGPRGRKPLPTSTPASIGGGADPMASCGLPAPSAMESFTGIILIELVMACVSVTAPESQEQ